MLELSLDWVALVPRGRCSRVVVSASLRGHSPLVLAV